MAKPGGVSNRGESVAVLRFPLVFGSEASGVWSEEAEPSTVLLLTTSLSCI